MPTDEERGAINYVQQLCLRPSAQSVNAHCTQGTLKHCPSIVGFAQVHVWRMPPIITITTILTIIKQVCDYNDWPL